MKLSRFLPQRLLGSLDIHRAVSNVRLRRQNLRLPGGEPAGGEKALVSRAVNAAIPRLAWLCRREGHRFHFTLGQGVEQFDQGFFEGVWAGDFGRPDQLPQCLNFGSGAIFSDEILFLATKQAYEFIFVLRDHRRGVDYVSPSLCFCLAASGAHEDADFFQRLARDLVTKTHRAVMAGAYGYHPRVVATSSFTLYRFFYGNFTLAPSGRMRIRQYYHGRTFPDFISYRSALSTTLDALLRNGADSKRRHPLSPMTTLSRGYDSPAVAVLAKELGCTDAVTMAVQVGGREDSGVELGRRLGLRVHAFEHAMGREIPELRRRFGPELASRAAEFIATAGLGDDIAFLPFEPALGNRVLLTGAWGDRIWERSSEVASGLSCMGRFGKSLTEFRLRTGFAFVPVPMIHGLFPASITALSRSPELAGYSVGGDYDRPICRRIVETAGIPRSEFASAKCAINPDPTDGADLWPDAVREIIRRYPT